VNQAYHSLKNKMKDAEADIHEFIGDNKETIEKFKGKFEDITKELGNAFERAFNKKDS
jgi:hypothetical protein